MGYKSKEILQTERRKENQELEQFIRDVFQALYDKQITPDEAVELGYIQCETETKEAIVA